jgi:uncharacterized Zn finger protein
MAAQPKCPSCGGEGKEKVISTSSDQKAPGGMAKFEIVHCSDCGHVYGVFPNIMIPG